MKKSLLLLSAAAIATCAYGENPPEPKLLTGSAIQALSPNGKWAVSEYLGTITLINLETNEEVTFGPTETDYTQYTLGKGLVLTDEGMLLCSSDNGGATFYQDGKWTTLNSGDAALSMTSCNGIATATGRICGDLGLAEMTTEDVTMIVPAIWDRNADGSYGDYVVLPHPDLDITGRLPQYVFAQAISEDGKTVVGQIIDYRGAFTYPILYKQDAEGKWSYTLPTEALNNPDHIVLPEEPGESPVQPDPKDYMSAETRADYQAKYDAWIASGFQSDLYPGEAQDYLTEEEKAKYDSAMAAYNQAKEEWDNKFNAFDEAYFDIIGSSPNFQMNQVALSPDGQYFAMTWCQQVDDPMSWFPVYIDHVWVFDTETDEITKYEDQECSVKSWAAGCVLAATRDSENGSYNGYLLKDGKTTSLYDYLCAIDETIKDWVDLNMVHDVESYDYETEEVVIKKITATGLPSASADLSIIASWTETSWTDTYEPESYIFDLRGCTGLTAPAARKSAPAFDTSGNLIVGADAAEVAVYNLAGTCVLKVASPAATIACDIAKGLYLVKTTYTDGTAATAKLVR